MHVGLQVKYPLFLSYFNETWFFIDRLWNNHQIENFIKIRSVEAEFFHADGQTDMTKLIVAFCNFANAPKNYFRIFLCLEGLNSQAIKCQSKCCSDLKHRMNGISAVSCVVIRPLVPSYKATRHVPPPPPTSPLLHITSATSRETSRRMDWQSTCVCRPLVLELSFGWPLK
jgi:hypothetical protein